MRQFTATVTKNVIEKRRNIRVTFCELFSHLIVFVILLLGFRQSKIIFLQPESYVKLNVLVPPTILRPAPARTSKPTSRPTGPLISPPSNSTFTLTPMIRASAVLDGFKKQLKGPLPIPSFDAYISAMRLVSSIADERPYVTRLLSQTSQGMRFGNLLTAGDLHFCPYPSSAVDSLVEYLNRTTTTFKTLKIFFHASESVGLDYVLKNLDRRTLALINIRQISPQKIDYVIRQNYTTLPNTNQVFISILRGLDTGYQSYFISGFLTLESTIDKWALDYSVKQVNPQATCVSPDVVTVPFPTYEFNSNPFYAQVGFLLGLAMTMSTLYPVSRLVKSVVEEKETRMREVMKIMGLNQTAHQLSWFFTAFITFFWISVSSTLISHATFLPNSDLGLLFLFFFLFHMSEITLSFLISVFFSNAKLAAIVGPVVLFVTILPKYIFFGSNSNEAAPLKYAASLLSPSAFAFGADVIADYEFSGVGIRYSNIRDNEFNMLSVYQMMVVDIFIYGFFAWYLDQTIPHEYGTPRHPLFIFNPFYWFPCLRRLFCFKSNILLRRYNLRSLPSEMNTKRALTDDTELGTVTPGMSRKSTNSATDMDVSVTDLAASSDKRSADSNLFLDITDNEEIPDQLKTSGTIASTSPPKRVIMFGERSVRLNEQSEEIIQAVKGDIEQLSQDQIDHVKVIASCLGKRYSNGKVAVQDFNIAMLEGQITCLLGHNGAGKSTVIAMITGLTTISDGDCTVYDRPIPAALSEIRTITGICPQQNVLFPSLTVKEHLNFFGSIKGLYGKERKEEVLKMIHDVGLFAKQDTPAGALSGGMKRKLQLAMALIGGSQFLILDEPTSGMDPFSRRATWELLQRHKAGRVIVLTTHFLEEADILGDRIAIMSEGHVRTSGSSLFLKNRFGAGYLLSISITRMGAAFRVKSEKEHTTRNYLHGAASSDVDETEAHVTPLVDVETLEDVVKSFVPLAMITSQVAGEVIFSLPIQSVPAFAELFGALQQKSAVLGVESYGVSLTSLEQVFIKLAKENEAADVDLMPRSLYLKAKSSLHNMVIGAGNRIGGIDFKAALAYPLKGSRYRESGDARIIPSQSVSDVELPGLSDMDLRVDTTTYKGDGRELSACDTSNGGNTTLESMTSVEGYTGPSEGRITRPQVKKSHRSGSVVPTTPEALMSPDSSHRDAEAPSPDISSCWSVDARLHSCENHGLEKQLKLKMRNFEDLDDEADDKAPQSKTHIQAFELLHKRFITASRDLKGIFFQIIFPAIQILLILAILIININPAGRKVEMNASIFKFDPSTIISGRTRPGDVSTDLAANRMKLSRYAANTSQALSLDLLDTGNKYFKGAKALAKKFPSPNRRLGAIVYKDTLEVKFDVDYNWIKDNLAFLLSNTDFLQFILSILKIDIRGPQRVEIPSYIIDGLIKRQKPAVPVSGEKQKEDLKQYIRDVGSAANLNTSVINRILNSTVVNDFNYTKATDVTFDRSLTVGFNGIDANSRGITFRDFYVDDRRQKLEVGTFRLSRRRIRSLLPGRILEYVFMVPVPVTIMHNTTSAHGIAAYRGEVVAAAWQRCYSKLNITSQQRADNPQVAYLAKNHPLPLTGMQSLENRITLSLLAGLFILVPLCYIPASFITFVVRERMSKSKHLQLVSSVSPYLYWATTYLWDVGLFLILVLLIIASLYIYGKKAAEVYISVPEVTFAMFLLLVLYGMSVLPLCYLYSMNFSNHSTAQISIMAINFATGFVAVLAYFVMNAVPETRVAASQIVHFFRFFPPYNIGEGMINITSAFYDNTLLDKNISYFDYSVTGRNLIFMFIEAVGYFSLVLLTESTIYRRAMYWIEKQRALLVLKKSVMESTDEFGNVVPTALDEDVLIEEEAVKGTQEKENFALCIQDLIKIYPSTFFGGKPKHAVRGLTLGCRYGERFGFLGVNGAGKSTTLNVLTGDIAPTGGEVYIGGMPLSDPKTRQAIGYCPQTDPLFDLMTARETLWFYGRIRGISEVNLKRRVEALICQVGLTPHADRTSGTYSGGNKRKLSLAISLIGSPRVLLLDEPSSGMDPFARRQMWDVIAAVSEKRSVILTTHSMEECEALCTRIGIMVDGRLRCLGPSSHLKARFGTGYQIEVRFSAEDRFEETMELLRGICEDIEIDEKHGQFLRLKVPALDLAYAFQILEESKVRVSGCIVDYTVSQNTLEQVFLKFARLQEQIEGEEAQLPVAGST